MILINTLFTFFIVCYLLDRHVTISNNFIDILFFIYDRVNPLKTGTIVESYLKEEKDDKYQIIGRGVREYDVQILNPKPTTNGNKRYYAKEMDRAHIRRYFKISEISKFNDDLKKLIK